MCGWGGIARNVNEKNTARTIRIFCKAERADYDK